MADDTEPQTQIDDDRETVDGDARVEAESSDEPWARLIGMGPTCSVGVIELTARVVNFGNASKNAQAHIRFDDPRVR